MFFALVFAFAGINPWGGGHEGVWNAPREGGMALFALAACGDDGGGLVDARRTTDASGTTTDAPSSTVDAEGPAIDAERLERIFEYGVTDASAPGESRGQGLFVARTYMAKMGGTITAANADGGVRFVLHLPRATPRASA